MKNQISAEPVAPSSPDTEIIFIRSYVYLHYHELTPTFSHPIHCRT